MTTTDDARLLDEKWLLVPRCQAQAGANSSTDYELWDCKLAAGHYGSHEAETPDGASWTDGTTEIDPLHMVEYERDEALHRLKADESRIRELEEALRLMRSSDLVLSDTHDPYTCEQPSCVLARRLLDEVQDAR